MDETTKRLVGRCVQIPWLREIEEDRDKELANKYLGIGVNVKAGESNLSMVEVAAHKVKPGVQTPSRGKEEVEALMGETTSPIEVGNGVSITVSDGYQGLGELKSPFEVEGEA